MCLLFSGSSTAIRAAFLNTPGLIEDVYDKNSDGFGFMYSTTHKGQNKLKVVKQLPRSAADVRKMFEALPNDDRMVAGHARMRTHGDINLDNCHPYPINDASWLMHNGILHTGNKKDTSKSDTWHFIEEFLKEAQPDTLHDPAMVKLLGEFIDNNRFAIMSADGRLSVVNKYQGLEHAGVWFSNTYAWSPSLLIPSYRTKTYGYWGGHLTERELDEAFEDRTSAEDDTYDESDIVELVMECLDQSDTYKLADTLDVYGAQAISAILENWMINTYREFNEANFGVLMRKTVEAWASYDDEHLFDMLDTEPRRVIAAEALLFYCDMEYAGEYEFEDDETLDEPVGAAYVDGATDLIRLN